MPSPHQGSINDVGHGTDRLNVLDMKPATGDQQRQPMAKPRLAAPGPCGQGLRSPARRDIGDHQGVFWRHDAADLSKPYSLVAPMGHRRCHHDQIECRIGEGKLLGCGGCEGCPGRNGGADVTDHSGGDVNAHNARMPIAGCELGRQPPGATPNIKNPVGLQDMLPRVSQDSIVNRPIQHGLQLAAVITRRP
jgi:hypothetical protein